MKRLVIKRNGHEESISAKSNWKLWKFALTLNKDELEALVTTYRKKLKNVKDDFKKRKLRQSILILSDCWKIKSRCRNIEDDELNHLLEEARDISKQILNYLNFKTEIYISEIDSIIDSLKNERLLASKCKIYDEYIYAGVIVTEILEYYGAKFNTEDIISNFNLDQKQFLDLKVILKHWLKGNYWKPNLVI